jgi:long-chain fatty acid transport protein
MAFAVVPGVALATNGMFLIGTSANHRAMGGAGIANPMDGTSAFYNPALAMHLDMQGMRADIGATFFSPKRRACNQSIPECTVSGATIFLLPHMGGAMQFKRNLTFGFVGVPIGGGNTVYHRDLFVDGGPENTVGVDLKVMEMMPIAAYKLNDTVSLGGGPVFAVAQFKAYGLESFVTPAITKHPDSVTDNGNDWEAGWGLRLGGLLSFMDDKIRLGASYTSKLEMSGFDKYKGLFSPNGQFDIPERYGVGIALKPIDKLTIAFDVTRTLYSDVQAIGNPITNTVGTFGEDNSGLPKLGEEGGGGFGWEDQTVYKLGFNYDWSDNLALRMGFNYGKSPIPNDESVMPNMLAPATVEKHATLGLAYKLSPTLQVGVAYMHAFKHKQSTIGDDDVRFNIAPGGGAAIEMVQNSLDMTLGITF